jgi:uncharacterized protein DUF5985
MYQLITGMLSVLSLVAALFFAMSWRRSGDRFFLIFALAFTLLGIERLILGILNLPESPLLSIYIVRLVAFLLIIIAIIDKNRTALPR